MVTFTFDESQSLIILPDGRQLPLNEPEAFRILSDAWLRCGWDTKYVYGFTWMGRPIIQLPEDLVRIQETIFAIQPDIIIETGVAHGGSLVFYAGLCAAIGKGRVVGIDIEIRPHNREAIESHRLSHMITLIEGSSIDQTTVDAVRSEVKAGETVLILLDSNHSKEHVLAELEAYAPMVSLGSYIVVCDGIMKQVAGAPRTSADWDWNNPISAIDDFLKNHNEFENVEPEWPFNEGHIATRVTYWPRAFLKRR